MEIWMVFAVIFGALILVSAWENAKNELEMEEKIREHEQKVEQEEAKNRELINKALKHYAETKGIK